MDYFNNNERVRQKKFANYRDKVLKNIIVFFIRIKITKDIASFIGVVFLFLTCFTDPYKYWWIVLVGLFLYLFFDAIDGGIARYTNTSSENGSVIDIICDQLGVVFLSASSIYFYNVNGIISLLYANGYIAFIIFVVYLNTKNIKLLPFVRVKYPFYFIYLITPFIGVDIISTFMLFFSIYYICIFFIFLKYIL